MDLSSLIQIEVEVEHILKLINTQDVNSAKINIEMSNRDESVNKANIFYIEYKSWHTIFIE